jgi:hypothetical protein
MLLRRLHLGIIPVLRRRSWILLPACRRQPQFPTYPEVGATVSMTTVRRGYRTI